MSMRSMFTLTVLATIFTLHDKIAFAQDPETAESILLEIESATAHGRSTDAWESHDPDVVQSVVAFLEARDESLRGSPPSDTVVEWLSTRRSASGRVMITSDAHARLLGVGLVSSNNRSTVSRAAMALAAASPSQQDEAMSALHSITRSTEAWRAEQVLLCAARFTRLDATISDWARSLATSSNADAAALLEKARQEHVEQDEWRRDDPYAGTSALRLRTVAFQLSIAHRALTAQQIVGALQSQETEIATAAAWGAASVFLAGSALDVVPAEAREAVVARITGQAMDVSAYRPARAACYESIIRMRAAAFWTAEHERVFRSSVEQPVKIELQDDITQSLVSLLR